MLKASTDVQTQTPYVWHPKNCCHIDSGFISIISNYNSFSLRVCINLIECQYLRRLSWDAILDINQQINKSKYFIWCWMAIYIEMCTLHLSFNIQVHVHLITYFSNCFSHMLTNCCTRHFILKFEIDKVVLGRQIALFFCWLYISIFPS